MKIASVVLNEFLNDNRVLKENMSLLNAGHNPRVIALYKQGLKEEEEQNGISVKRIKVKSRNWPRSIFFSAIKYFEFLLKAFKETKNCDVVHCNDLETLPVGYFRKKINSKVKLVYDAHEYETQKTTTGHPLRMKLNKIIERWLIKTPDAVITVSNSIADEYQRLYNIEKPKLIYNCPPLSFYDNENYDLFREKFGIRQDQVIYLHQGGFTSGRGIELIIDAFANMKDDKNVVVFMGFGALIDKVTKAVEDYSNIYYHEKVSYEDIVKHTKAADWGLICTENISLNNYMSLPNKLFEYIMAELPIIALPNIEIKNKIEKYHVGLVSESETVEDLTKTITASNGLDRSEFSPGLKQMREIFNWEEQEVKLIEIYNNL